MKNKQIWGRIGQIVLVLLGISFVTFALVMLSPGDPVRQMIAGNEDIVVSQVEIDALRHELGLDKPFVFQYLDWLGRAVQGNFGFSYMVKKPVVEELMQSLPATLILALASTFFMLIFSLPLGIYSAVKRNSIFDYAVRGLTFFGVSIPNFWMGLMLLWIFGLKLGWLPIVGGRVSLETLILPATTLGIVMAAKYTRQVRTTVLEELNQDYVVGARARGMSESYILWREVLPNAMLPLITLLGLSFGSLLGGAAVVEIVFSWPGLGYLAVQSIIIAPISEAAVIIINGKILGTICFHKICVGLPPLTTAASTKSRFFIFNTILRAKRAYLVQVTIVKAIIALIRLPPRIPAIAMASIIPGKEIIISEIRIITVSTFPPK